jgi:hypothetical protein
MKRFQSILEHVAGYSGYVWGITIESAFLLLWQCPIHTTSEAAMQ